MPDFTMFVTQTKIVVPRRRADLLLRQRLVNQLKDLLNNKLVTVTAPAGYGKTSLLLEAAHQTTLPGCWFALDPLDNDPQRFVSHFVATIALRFPKLAQFSTGLLAADNRADLETLIGPVVNAIYRHIREPFMFVLDDFHLITNPEIINFVDLFAQLVGDNCRLVISSRRVVELPHVLLLLGRARAGELGPADLGFRADEIRALFEQNYNYTVLPEVAANLAHETAGWITGLLLAAPGLLADGVDRWPQARIPGERVYDYLASQVLEQQPASVQDFLLRTSLLEEFDAGLCRQVLGEAVYADGHTWESLTHLVVRNNLFVLPIDEPSPRFRYHQLFQEFLQNRIGRLRPREANHIRRKLATIFTEHGQWEKAQAIYLWLGDGAAAANVIEQAGLSLVRAGRFITLETWLNGLPPGLRDQNPWLLALNGYTEIMLGRVKYGLSLLNQAETDLRAGANPERLARTLVWRCGVRRLLGQYQAALNDANEGLLLAENDNSPLSLKAMALRAKGQCLVAIRQSAPAILTLEESLALYKELAEKENVARLYLETGVAYLTVGRYQKANCYFELAEQYYQKVDNLIRLADLFNNWGVLHHLTGNFPQAIRFFEQALTCARQSRYPRLEAYALCGIADIYADLDALDGAELAYRQAQQAAYHTDDNFLLFYLELVKAVLARQRGDLALARGLLKDAARQINATVSLHEHGLYYLEAGLLAQAEGRLPEAVAQLQQAVNCFADNGQHIETARAQLHLAVAGYAAQNSQLAAQAMSAALGTLATLESLQPVVPSVRAIAANLRQISQQPDFKKIANGCYWLKLLNLVDEFNRNLTHYRRMLRRQSCEVAFTAPKLAITAFGPVRVYLNNELLGGPEWVHRQARELFFYLLAQPQGQSKEIIGCDLWPDCSAHDMKVRFKNAVYRLRRVLGDDWILFDKDFDVYMFNRDCDYEYDVEQFEQRWQQANVAKSPAEKVNALQQAIALYRGPYLPDIDHTWAFLERQRLQYLFLQAQLTLARYFFTLKNYNQTLAHCQTVLQLEPGEEVAHRLIMKIYAAAGNRIAVIRQYKQCQKTLHEEVNAPVSAKTRNLFENLLRETA